MGSINYFYDFEELDCIDDYIDEFPQVNKKLHIPECLDPKDSFFNSICYTVTFIKTNRKVHTKTSKS